MQGDAQTQSYFITSLTKAVNVHGAMTRLVKGIATDPYYLPKTLKYDTWK